MRALGIDVAEAPVPFAREGAERLVAAPGADGRPFLTVDRDASGSFEMAASGFGVQRVAADGRTMEVAQAADPAWRNERLRASQALPTAALLRGVAVLHAAAVDVRGRAVALTGPPGAGKSSVAVSLAAGGGTLLCDDVLGVTPEGAEVLAHPGPRLANVARDVWAGLGDRGRAGLGEALGESDDVHVRLPPDDAGPRPLALWCFLLRDREGGLEVGEAGAVVPMLLGSAYATHIATPERHARHLEACTAIARAAHVVTVRSGPEASAADVAQALRSLLGR